MKSVSVLFQGDQIYRVGKRLLIAERFELISDSKIVYSFNSEKVSSLF